LLHSLKGPYAQLLATRYKMAIPLADIPGTHDDVLLEEVGRRRGAVMGGGRVNLQKAAEIVINDFRSAALGRITLETPEEIQAWLAAAQAAEQERARLKQLEAKAKKSGGRTARNNARANARKDPRGL
jgi:ribosome biogenesis GTPase A